MFLAKNSKDQDPEDYDSEEEDDHEEEEQSDFNPTFRRLNSTSKFTFTGSPSSHNKRRNENQGLGQQPLNN